MHHGKFPSFPSVKYFGVWVYGRNKSADILTKPASTGGGKEQLELGGC
jgi:hypothetical protein